MAVSSARVFEDVPFAQRSSLTNPLFKPKDAIEFI